MPKKDQDTIRPQLLVSSAETAREIVAERFGADLAGRLGDGDVIDLAFKILKEAKEQETES